MLCDKDRNEQLFLSDIEKVLSSLSKKKVVVSDGDETISLMDTSKLLFLNNHLDHFWSQIRYTFSRYGRNYAGYSRVAEIYSGIPYQEYIKFCEAVIDQVVIRTYWQKVIDSGFPVVIVTSGARKIWELLIQKNNWKNVVLIGGNNYNEKNWVMCPELKKLVCQYLKYNENKLMVIGDSYIDFEMLCEGLICAIVTNERFSPKLFEACSNTGKSFVEVDDFYHRNYDGIIRRKISDILIDFKHI